MRSFYVELKMASRLLVGLLFWSISFGLAPAQEFPSRTITIILPFSAGGGVDILLRKYADVVAKNVNRPVIIQNMPGGGGLVGAIATLNAAPDGHTLYLATPATHTSMPAFQSMPFDPLRDFRAITQLFYFQNVLTIPSKIPSTSIGEFVEYGRSKPDGLVYGSPGYGSAAHILGAMFSVETAIKAVHTPFKNGPEMNLSLMRGDLDYGFGTYWGMQQFWRAGQVKILAVNGAKRAKVFPDYPTFSEAGYPNLDSLLSWYGLVVRAGTPDAVVQRLAEEFEKASKDTGIVEYMAQSAFEGSPEGPAAFAALMARDTELYSKVIPALGLKK